MKEQKQLKCDGNVLAQLLIQKVLGQVKHAPPHDP